MDGDFMKICIFYNSDEEFDTKELFIDWLENKKLEEDYHGKYLYWRPPRNKRLNPNDIIIFAYGNKEIEHTWLVGEAKVKNCRRIPDEKRIQKTYNESKEKEYDLEFELV